MNLPKAIKVFIVFITIAAIEVPFMIDYAERLARLVLHLS